MLYILESNILITKSIYTISIPIFFYSVRGSTPEGSLKLGSTIGQAKVTRLYSIES